jgi:HSP20 family protein
MLALRFNTNALDEMFNLANEFESAMTGAPGATRRSAWTPAVEVRETEDQVSMAVELPGIDPSNVNLSVKDGVLTISGEQQPPVDQEGKSTVRYSERWYGRFERSFTLPSGVEPGRIDASYDAGILTIRLHKSEQAKPRQIQIAVGSQAQIGAGQK